MRSARCIRLLSLLAAAGGCLAFPGQAHAQPVERVPVRVELSGLDGPLRANVESLLGIATAARTGPVRPAHAYRLHDRAADEIRKALEPFGRYQPAVEASLETGSSPWIARYAVDPGPPLILDRVDIRVSGEAETDSVFQAALARIDIASGDTLNHPAYEGTKSAIELLAADRGYLDASWDSSLVRVDLAAYTADVVLVLQAGPRFRFGDVRFDREWVDADIVSTYARFQPGDPYESSRLRDLQSNLAGTTYFSNVEIVPRRDLADEELRVPIDIHTTPRKTQRYEVGVGYGTDTGPRVRFAVEFRRLNRRGHYADIDARLSTSEQSLTARYNFPVGLPDPALWTITGRFGRIEWVTSETVQGLVGPSYAHLRGSVREVFSLRYQQDDFKVAADTGVSRLTQPIAAWTYSNADNHMYATRGYGGGLELRGAVEGVASSASFFRASTNLKAIRGFSPRIRGTLRADIGWLETSQFSQLPPSIRFFAGGDRSVRGYAYQSLGPENGAGDVTGGNSLLVGSAELEYRFLEKWAGAVFFDAGNALRDFRGEIAAGTGLGVRWISPVGLIRIDGAFGLQVEGRKFRVHLSIGPDF